MAPFQFLSALILGSIASVFPVALSTALAVDTATPPAYGHWDLHYTSGSDTASGSRWEYVNATYSGPPAVAVTCKQLYDPATRKTARTCDDASFGYSVGIILGRSVVVVEQTVQQPGSSTPVAIDGEGAIVITCTQGAAGKTCEATVQVQAVAAGDDSEWWS